MSGMILDVLGIIPKVGWHSFRKKCTVHGAADIGYAVEC